MDNSIGIGAIVGLTFASSLFVWNSYKFSSSQKTVLLICVIFPPAQWLGILLVLIYNNYEENNSTEKIKEREVEQVKDKLDSSINSLKDLRDKGILTDEEYRIKVNKLENEKAQQEIQSSSEYKQLKRLLDSNVLTKEEFENKIKILNSATERYLNDIKDEGEMKKMEEDNYKKFYEKNENDTKLTIYVLSFLFILLATLIYFTTI